MGLFPVFSAQDSLGPVQRRGGGPRAPPSACFARSFWARGSTLPVPPLPGARQGA